MSLYHLDFCSIRLLDPHMAEIIINEGVEMDLPMVDTYHAFLRAHLQPPFSLLINKVNAYTYRFEAQQKLATIPEIHAMAVVAYNRVSSLATASLIHQPRNTQWNIRVFSDYAPALKWLQEEQHKARQPMLTVQQAAPSFHSHNQAGTPVSLNDFHGKQHVVLYFYPKDDTPGCTIEANQFTALADEFAALNTAVLGVSKDSCSSHQQFVDKFGLRVELLADTDGSLCDAYGVWQEKEKNGEKKMGIVRSTFIIDKQGLLRHVEYGVSADGHAQAILQKVKAL